MKLYDVPYGTNIRLRDDEGNALELKFHYIDGSYSYCTDKEGNALDLKFHYLDGMFAYCTDKNGNPQHIALWTDVEITDGEPA